MITVLYCGHDSRHPSPFSILHAQGLPHYLLLLVKSPCYFELDGVQKPVSPNTAFLFSPHTRICYGCRSPLYNDDWIHFSLSPDDNLLERLRLPVNAPLSVSCISHLTEYVRLMVQEQHVSAENRTLILDALMRAMLLSLKDQLAFSLPDTGGRKYFSELSSLRISIHNTPGRDWRLEKMADSLHMSVSYFQHLYTELFGISCRRDIILARIASAKFYLSTTDLPVRTVASLCGYENELHFMRQFKKYAGTTPSKFRSFHSQAALSVKNQTPP